MILLFTFHMKTLKILYLYLSIIFLLFLVSAYPKRSPFTNEEREFYNSKVHKSHSTSRELARVIQPRNGNSLVNTGM